MSDLNDTANSQPAQPTEAQNKSSGAGKVLTLASALLVLVLALGAIFWPAAQKSSLSGVVLVFDSSGDALRQQELYLPLVTFLERGSGYDMQLVVAADKPSFQSELGKGADFVFCPDGLAFTLDSEQYVPLVVGRRAAPRNLRPCSVLISRISQAEEEKPWQTQPQRTVFGDSLSLVGMGAAVGSGPAGNPSCAYGPDPYDHGPVLQAARLGAFDHAIVRQWDADRFLESGLLPRGQWRVKTLTGPVPDVMVMVSRELPAQDRLELGQSLAALGRDEHQTAPATAALARGLASIRLVGFNLIVEPDFERVRGLFASHWQGEAQ